MCLASRYHHHRAAVYGSGQGGTRAFCVSLLIRETDHRNGAAGGLIQIAASLVVPFAFVHGTGFGTPSSSITQ